MAVLKALLTGKFQDSGFLEIINLSSFCRSQQNAGSINWGAKKYYTGSGYAAGTKEDAEKHQLGSAQKVQLPKSKPGSGSECRAVLIL